MFFQEKSKALKITFWVLLVQIAPCADKKVSAFTGTKKQAKKQEVMTSWIQNEHMAANWWLISIVAITVTHILFIRFQAVEGRGMIDYQSLARTHLPHVERDHHEINAGSWNNVCIYMPKCSNRTSTRPHTIPFVQFAKVPNTARLLYVNTRSLPHHIINSPIWLRISRPCHSHVSQRGLEGHVELAGAFCCVLPSRGRNYPCEYVPQVQKVFKDS